MKLFKTPETILTKTAYQRVSQNAGDWTKDVMEAFYSQYPQLAQIPVKLEWKNKDPEKGYGVGNIVLQDNSNLTVPVVIKQLELYPFDIAYASGNPMPLTQETLAMYNQTKGAFLRAVPKAHGDITEALFGQGMAIANPQGDYSYQKQASFCEKIANTITDESKSAFLADVPSDIFDTMKMNGTSGAILKLASAHYEPTSAVKNITSGIDRNIHYIYKTASNEWVGVFGNNVVNDAVTLSLDEVSAARFDEHIKTATLSNMPAQAATTDHNEYVALNGGLYNYEIKTASDAAPGDYGVLAIGEHKSSPLSVLSKFAESRGLHLNTNSLEKKAEYVIMTGIDGMHDENGITYVSPEAKFIKLSYVKADVTPATYVPENWIQKTASKEYNIGGPVFEAYLPSEDRRDLDVHAATWDLIQCGASKEDVIKVAELAPGERMYINHELRAPVAITKLAEAIDKDTIDSIQILQLRSKDLFKLAAQVPDAPTVDAALSLNFITKDNMGQFIDAIPDFEYIIHRVSSLLMQVRLGTLFINENLLRRTMLDLVDVISQLRALTTIKKK